MTSNVDDGVDISSETSLAHKRDKTTNILQTLASMVPDMCDGILSEIHDSALSMLSLARQPNRGAMQIRKDLGEHQLKIGRRVVMNDSNQIAEEMNVTSLKDLPEELIVRVMTYLNVADRKATRLVNKQWHRLSYEKKLIENDWTKIEASEYFNNTSPNSRHLNIKVYENNNLTEIVPFWKQHGQKVEKIEVHCIIGKNRALPLVLRYCPNVKHVIVSLGLTVSSSLNISFPVMPSLHFKRLTLYRSSLGNTTYASVRALFFPKSKEEVTDVSGLIEGQSTTHEEYLAFSSYKQEDFTQMVQSIGPELTQLNLSGVRNLTDSNLYAIVENFVNLEHLHLSYIASPFPFLPSSIEHAITTLKKLTHLSICGTDFSSASHSLFTAIDNLTQLIAIDLDGTYNLKAENLIAAFRSPHPKLMNLRLDGNSIIDNFDFLTQICPNLPNLVGLGLSEFILEEEHIQAIAQHNTCLEELSLTSSNLQDCSSTCLNEIKNLVHLGLASCSYCDDIVIALELPRLHTIDLTGLSGTEPQDILQVLKKNSSLHRVEVTNYSYEEEMYPIDDVINDEIRAILKRRTPSRPCRNIFSSPDSW